MSNQQAPCGKCDRHAMFEHRVGEIEQINSELFKRLDKLVSELQGYNANIEKLARKSITAESDLKSRIVVVETRMDSLHRFIMVLLAGLAGVGAVGAWISQL